MTAPETSELIDVNESRRTISRRTLVRTGATAAWAVPAISVATAAPALAVSNQGDLNGSGIVAIYQQGPKRLVITVNPITNAGDIQVGAITLILSVPKEPGALATKPNKVSHSGAGWSYVRSAGSSNRWDYYFTYPQGLEPGAQTSTLTVTLSTSSNKKPLPSGNVSYVATARNSDPASGSAPITTV